MKPLRRFREELITVACWPQYSYLNHDLWLIFELQIKPDGSLDWFLRGPLTNGFKMGEISYDNLDDALAEVRISNQSLALSIHSLPMPPAERLSLQLKVEKALTVEERHMKEERMMLLQAKKKHALVSPPPKTMLLVPDSNPVLQDALHDVLQFFPYLQLVRLDRYGITLMRKGDYDWTTSVEHSRRTAIYCYREKIARGFGFSGSDHWGKTKAAIRQELLPRANKLLHQASFKLLLADALNRGQKVVVFGGFVFWYEEDGAVGWVVKGVGSSGASKKGETIWYEGRILSTNHGRIVILPYIKENGERVQGHTKNAAHDGRAEPRHPDHYVELPFEILDGDLMYDLLGDLKYE